MEALENPGSLSWSARRGRMSTWASLAVLSPCLCNPILFPAVPDPRWNLSGGAIPVARVSEILSCSRQPEPPGPSITAEFRRAPPPQRPRRNGKRRANFWDGFQMGFYWLMNCYLRFLSQTRLQERSRPALPLSQRGEADPVHRPRSRHVPIFFNPDPTAALLWCSVLLCLLPSRRG